MSMVVSAVKARQNLGELLNLVSIKHEEIIIERAGKKIARLTAVEDAAGEPAVPPYAVRQKDDTGTKASGALTDISGTAVPERPDILDLSGLGREMWKSTGLTPDEYIRKEREEWN